jgi:membrane-associated phospholipid phosphatase
VVGIVIGFARVWVGVHYPADIAAAAVIAGLATVMVWILYRWLSQSVELDRS